MPSAPGAASVQVWHLMSRGRGPRTGPPPPDGVYATYPPAGGRSCYLSSRGIEAGRRVITAKLIRAPGNDAPIGGLKVIAAGGWFAARPSGTENVYKIYAESFKGESHLEAFVREAQAMVDSALR